MINPYNYVKLKEIESLCQELICEIRRRPEFLKEPYGFVASSAIDSVIRLKVAADLVYAYAETWDNLVGSQEDRNG